MQLRQEGVLDEKKYPHRYVKVLVGESSILSEIVWETHISPRTCFTSSSDVLLVDSLFLARTISSKEEFSLTPSSFIALSALIIEGEPGSPIDARTTTPVLRNTSLALLFAFVVNTPVPTRASRGRNMALVLQRSRHCPEATCNPIQAMLAMGGTC
jgi:hypothetical protein